MLEIETVVDPSANTQLMGLYRAGGTYCTQCEAEGFRRITYFPDRPDVMAVYTTRIEADKAEVPVLLANGNLVAAGDVAGTTRHFAVWHDPFPKPSYLFALVGGELGHVEDAFVTMSGRKVALRIYVEPGKESRAGLRDGCAEARHALGRGGVRPRIRPRHLHDRRGVRPSTWGRWRTRASTSSTTNTCWRRPRPRPTPTTPASKAIIAHEYFHNWTGNRITCRDWFQLCLKEGLTVFRDQEFSADKRSRAVKRIADVRVLRAHQFVEDAGPLAHPVRPEVYREINNFYTPTVYEKGAEIVRMLKTLLGAEGFRKGMDLYFARHDGQAATVEEFVRCFADATGADLGPVHALVPPGRHAGGRRDAEPRRQGQDLHARDRPDAAADAGPAGQGADGDPARASGSSGRTATTCRSCSPTAARSSAACWCSRDPAETFVFADVAARPVASLNRGFSAPVKLTANLTADDLRFLAAHDGDPFNRWQALQTLASTLLIDNVKALRAGKPMRQDRGLVEALGAILADAAARAGLRRAGARGAVGSRHRPRARPRRRPGRDLHGARALARGDRDAARPASARHLSPPVGRRPYSPDAASAGRRSLKNVALDLLAASGGSAAIALAARQYQAADNMTDRMAALATLSLHPVRERQAAIDDFYRRYQSDPLVIDKWFALQAAIPEAATLDRVRELTRHPAFSLGNPNRVRSLIGAFAQMNQTQFNRADGAGYAFLADTVLALDGRNPQVASRMMTAFRELARARAAVRRAKAEAELRRVAAAPSLSTDVRDIVERSLAET